MDHEHKLNGLGPYADCQGCTADIPTKEQLDDMWSRTKRFGAPWINPGMYWSDVMDWED